MFVLKLDFLGFASIVSVKPRIELKANRSRKKLLKNFKMGVILSGKHVKPTLSTMLRQSSL